MAKARRQVSSNVYTVLLFIAMIALLGSIVYLLVRSQQLFGGRFLDTTIAALVGDGDSVSLLATLI